MEDELDFLVTSFKTKGKDFVQTKEDFGVFMKTEDVYNLRRILDKLLGNPQSMIVKQMKDVDLNTIQFSHVSRLTLLISELSSESCKDYRDYVSENYNPKEMPEKPKMEKGSDYSTHMKQLKAFEKDCIRINEYNQTLIMLNQACYQRIDDNIYGDENISTDNLKPVYFRFKDKLDEEEVKCFIREVRGVGADIIQKIEKVTVERGSTLIEGSGEKFDYIEVNFWFNDSVDAEQFESYKSILSSIEEKYIIRSTRGSK